MGKRKKDTAERERKREEGGGLKRLATPTLTILFFVVVASNVDSGQRCPHYSYAPVRWDLTMERGITTSSSLSGRLQVP